MKKVKTPYGALIPPYFNHQPAVVVGNRNYLLSLKEALIRNGFKEQVNLFIPSSEEIDSCTTAVFLEGERARYPIYKKVELVDEIKEELKERLQKEEKGETDEQDKS